MLVCVGLQYLEHPLAVFREVRRVLKADGVVIASFSNRCFPSKAVAIWQALDMKGQAVLIRLYLDKASFHDVGAHLLADGGSGDPLIAVVARALTSAEEIDVLCCIPTCRFSDDAAKPNGLSRNAQVIPSLLRMPRIN